jgi:hypothetical protein
MLAFIAGMAALAAGTATANPSGLFISSQSCAANGTVDAFLNWTPDSSGQQFVDLTGRNDNFSTAYATGGPFNVSLTRANLNRLQPNTTYYTRVRTQIGGQFLFSQTLVFTTISCGPGGGSTGGSAVSPPTNLQAAAFSATSARFQWVPGNGNFFFCLDFARSVSDLLSLQGTWRNSGCGNTSNSHVLTNLACGTTYYARVWTPAGGGLYSARTQVTTFPCASAISAPTNLQVVFETMTTARLDWTPGKDNIWYCVDTARSHSDLLSFRGTWRNHACFTTASQVTIGGLTCDTLYYWRVFAWNTITGIHSNVATFHTDDCDDTLVEAPIEDVDVDKVGSDYHVTIEAVLSNTCHSFASYQVQRSGNIVEITILNSVEDDDDCTAVIDTYELTINLGSSFTPGVTYTVIVNDDESDSFLATP